MLHVALQQHPSLRVCIEPLCDQADGYDEVCRSILRTLYGYEPPRTGKVANSAFATAKYLSELENHFDCAKLLYHHLNPELIVHIRQRPIIHLVRRNSLAIAVSLAVAQRREIWHLQSESSRALLDLSPVYIDVEKTLGTIRWLERCRAQFRDCFTVWYEDLCSDWDGQIERIEEFMGVPRVKLDQPFAKSVDRPLEMMIENLSEVQMSELGIYLEAC